jgi:hypothetical protein
MLDAGSQDWMLAPCRSCQGAVNCGLSMCVHGCAPAALSKPGMCSGQLSLWCQVPRIDSHMQPYLYQVGKDTEAQAFLGKLDTDREVGGMVDATVRPGTNYSFCYSYWICMLLRGRRHMVDATVSWI